MTLYTNLVGNALATVVRAAMPLVGRLDHDQLLALVPPIPGLRDRVRDDTLVMNFLRHLARRREPAHQVRDRIERYVVNPLVLGTAAKRRAREQHGIAGLSSISITQTVICNLHCDLCYNLTEIHHDPKQILPYELVDKILTEGKAIGAYRATFIGGEPLIRHKDILAAATAHPDVMITVITNGLLLTPEMARAFAATGNIELSISIDGLRATHDASRGAGTFDKVIAAMAMYRDAGGMLIFSPTVTSANHREILSDELLDLVIELGCYMGYYHHYDMIGGQDRKHLLLTMEQLRWMDQRIAEVVRQKPIAITDQVLSRLMVGGCPAVRDFIHVNHRGEVEACCMVPFASDSIAEKSLVDIMRSPFFDRINQIEADNGGVKRCLVGENTHVIEQAVADGVAHGTTKASHQVFLAHADEDGRLHPTCFSASITAGTADRAPRRRVRLPLLG